MWDSEQTLSGWLHDNRAGYDGDRNDADNRSNPSPAWVCASARENTLRSMNVKNEALMPFATTVDSGVAEVVRRQQPDGRI